MARTRQIKPAFFKNEHLAEISPFGRLLFIGLWTISDKYGRLEDRPRRVKAELFPYEDVDIVAMINELESAGFLFRYGDKNQYIQIVNFEKHQHPHKNEQDSFIPCPVDSSNFQKLPEEYGTTPPLNLKPYTSNLNGQTSGLPFSDFWDVYPRKEKRKRAEITWNRLSKTKQQKALSHLSGQPYADREKQYIPHPTTYMNNERWDDESDNTAGGNDDYCL